MIKKIKNFIMIVSLFFCVPSIVKAELPGARSASNSTGDVFLGGNYIEVGISKGGSFGTKASAPSEFHSHASSSVGLINFSVVEVLPAPPFFPFLMFVTDASIDFFTEVKKNFSISVSASSSP